MEACCVAARAARLNKVTTDFFKYTSKALAMGACSEICCELGRFYEELGDAQEAVLWYYNAVYEVRPVLQLTCGGETALEGMIRCYQALGYPEEAEHYRQELENVRPEFPDRNPKHPASPDSSQREDIGWSADIL